MTIRPAVSWMANAVYQQRLKEIMKPQNAVPSLVGSLRHVGLESVLAQR